jgi:hypothetical protein
MKPFMPPQESSCDESIASAGRATKDPSATDQADRLEAKTQGSSSPPDNLSANNAGLPNSPPRPLPPKPAVTEKSVTNSKPVETSARPNADKSPVQSPAAPHPSLPVSMTVHPDSASELSGTARFPVEAGESFEVALARIEVPPARSFLSRILAAIGGPSWLSTRRERTGMQRMVAFDGFRDDLFEDKRERDRRYGTVYSVSEVANAFLVRLELPRRMPKSCLKQTWELPDEMPDYSCTLSLADNVLCIRGSLPDEARRRVSYVSPSFPSDFLTRIDFWTPVVSYTYRLQKKVLEIIVNKAGVDQARKPRWQGPQR